MVIRQINLPVSLQLSFQVIMLYTHDENNNNTGGLCHFQYEQVYFFCLQSLTTQEERTNHKGLCWPYYADTHLPSIL